MAKKKVEPTNEAPAKKATAKKAAPVKPETTGPKAVKKAAAPKKTAKAPAAELLSVEPYSRFTDFDISLFKSGKHYKLYEKFGSHVVEFNGVVGTYFAVWAPNAQNVSLI